MVGKYTVYYHRYGNIGLSEAGGINSDLSGSPDLRGNSDFSGMPVPGQTRHSGIKCCTCPHSSWISVLIRWQNFRTKDGQRMR